MRSVTMVSGTTWSVIATLPGFTSLWRVMQLLAALGGVGRALVRGMATVHLLRPAVFPLFRHPFRVPGAVIAAIAKGYPANELWSTIGCPVTAFKGDRDVFVRDDDLITLRAAIPHARTLVIADCGHFANVEHPGAVLAALSR